MDAEKLERLLGKVTFISGGSKNAGKTTFLNYLLPRLRNRGSLAFLTIGIDGEKKDLVYGNEKPSIETETGDFFVTCESMADRSEGSFEICHVFPWKTALGRILLLRTLRSGLVELAGPENNGQLEEIIATIRNEYGIDTILVDGAVNRITQLAAGENASYYYVMRMTVDNRGSSLEKIRILDFLNKVPQIKEGFSDCDLLSLDGALTSSSLKELDNYKGRLLIEDFTKVFLTWRELKDLTDRVFLLFKKVFILEGVVINAFDLENSDIVESLSTLNIDIPIIFNPYILKEEDDD